MPQRGHLRVVAEGVHRFSDLGIHQQTTDLL